MDISTIERVMLEKCAKDIGWEIESNSSHESLKLRQKGWNLVKAEVKTRVCILFRPR